ncbi:TPA: LysR family transcriptional regulator [Klebsiella michiganensis]|nr:LysR family transcriptional regulator [Klebsiella michiganensis]HCT3875110.1 LysR family transcriptional regulator [Klebsiella michiganensis]
MAREGFSELIALIAVAQTGSFTRAAAQLGVTQPCNNVYDILEAVRRGFGLAYLPLDMVQPLLDSGELVSVLQEWCPLWPGLHLYYPNRRQHSRAMSLMVEALRFHAND